MQSCMQYIIDLLGTNEIALVTVLKKIRVVFFCILPFTVIK